MEAVHEIVKGKNRPVHFNRTQPKATLTGAMIKEIPWTLPYHTGSICPECGKVIRARKFVEDGKVYIEKTCVSHGYFRALVSSDVGFYMQVFTERSPDGRGVADPEVASEGPCPSACGICGLHHSPTRISVIEITKGLTLESAGGILRSLRGKRPFSAEVVLFSGSVPAEALDIVSKARELGFKYIAISDPKMVLAAAKLGANVLYIDELSTDIIELCRSAGMHIVASPSSEGAGGKVRFAYDNRDMVRALFFRLKGEETIADLAKRIEDETDHLMSTIDWYSLCSFPLFSTCHPDCGAGGYIEGPAPKRSIISRLFKRKDERSHPYDKLFVGAMQFQNALNFDIERAKRCVVHRTGTDGTSVPLCTLGLKRPA